VLERVLRRLRQPNFPQEPTAASTCVYDGRGKFAAPGLRYSAIPGGYPSIQRTGASPSAGSFGDKSDVVGGWLAALTLSGPDSYAPDVE
jgi:hypothetical protein